MTAEDKNHRTQKQNLDHHSFVWLSFGLMLISFMFGLYIDPASFPTLSKIKVEVQNRIERNDLSECYKTCRFVKSDFNQFNYYLVFP